LRREWRGRASRVDRGEPGSRLVRRGQGGARHPDLEIAAELGLRGITSNLVAPGFIAETEFFQGKLSDERRKRLLEATMMNREGELGDIAGTIFFLASSAARHITGQVLQVNGGALTSR
jgi:3-oxoacyl-[acyl-carrier protein] reductase